MESYIRRGMHVRNTCRVLKRGVKNLLNGLQETCQISANLRLPHGFYHKYSPAQYEDSNSCSIRKLAIPLGVLAHLFKKVGYVMASCRVSVRNFDSGNFENYPFMKIWLRRVLLIHINILLANFRLTLLQVEGLFQGARLHNPSSMDISRWHWLWFVLVVHEVWGRGKRWHALSLSKYCSCNHPHHCSH